MECGFLYITRQDLSLWADACACCLCAEALQPKTPLWVETAAGVHPRPAVIEALVLLATFADRALYADSRAIQTRMQANIHVITNNLQVMPDRRPQRLMVFQVSLPIE